MPRQLGHAAAAALTLLILSRQGRHSHCSSATGVWQANAPAACDSHADGTQAQRQAYTWGRRGSMRKAIPCFAAALQYSAHHPWLWTDYARALQGAAREGLAGLTPGCGGESLEAHHRKLSMWADELEEGTAAADVALLLGGDRDDMETAQRVRSRLDKTWARHQAAAQACKAWPSSSHTNFSLSRRAAQKELRWLVNAVATGSAPNTLDGAIALARARCRHAADVSVPLAGAHSSWLSAESAREVLLALRICGVVRLERLWRRPSDLDKIAAAHRREFESFLNDEEQHEDTHHHKQSQHRHRQATRRGVQRWKGRWESTLPLVPPFDDPMLTMQPALLAVVQAALGSARLELDTFTQITSTGDSVPTDIHTRLLRCSQ